MTCVNLKKNTDPDLVLDTTKYRIQDPGIKRTYEASSSSSHVLPKAGDDYEVFYTGSVQGAIKILKLNGETDATKAILQKLNQDVVAYNRQQKRKDNIGLFRDELRQFYNRGRECNRRARGASEEENKVICDELKKICEESQKFCDALGLSRDIFAWTWSKPILENPMASQSAGTQSPPPSDQPGTTQQTTPPGQTTEQQSNGQQPPPPSPPPNPPGTTQQTTLEQQAQASQQGMEGLQYHIGSTRVSLEAARQNKTTLDGHKMIAASRVGEKGWSVLVQEGTEKNPAFRFRTGRECGGGKLLGRTFRELPQLKNLGAKILEREKALKDNSQYDRILAIAQRGKDIYCLSRWQNGEEAWIPRCKLSQCVGSPELIDGEITDLGGQIMPRGLLSSPQGVAALLGQPPAFGLLPPPEGDANSGSQRMASEQTLQQTSPQQTGLQQTSAQSSALPSTLVQYSPQYAAAWNQALLGNMRMQFKHRAFPALTSAFSRLAI